MAVSDRRLSAFIVTIRRDPSAAPESYYVAGTDPKHASYRAARMAKATQEQVLEVIQG
jgi:hypothetical protein